jgi:hypothetical protein
LLQRERTRQGGRPPAASRAVVPGIASVTFGQHALTRIALGSFADMMAGAGHGRFVPDR